MKSLEFVNATRAAILYNPVARGLSRHKHLLQSSIEALKAQGIAAKLEATRAPGTAAAQARALIESGCDLIVAAGGDGTINEVANGMLHTGVPLAILPGGTANVLAREIRLPLRMDHAASQIRRLSPCRIAVGGVQLDGEPRIFLCMAGVGLDAEIVSRINLDLKATLGKFAYYVCGFGQVFRPLKEFDVTIDGRLHRASFALISRVRNYGGDLEIARGASLLCNDFEVVLFRGTASVRYLPYLFGVILRRAHRLKGCTVLRGRSVACTNASDAAIYFQLDGELVGKLPVAAGILPDALTLLMPPEYLSREQAAAVPACA